jgi:hypothetical protein
MRALVAEAQLARDLRTRAQELNMATKIKMLKLLQEIRGFAQITNRRPHPKPPGIFLMQLRSHVLQATSARRRLVIPIDLQEPPDIPHPVKITHLTTDPVAPA